MNARILKRRLFILTILLVPVFTVALHYSTSVYKGQSDGIDGPCTEEEEGDITEEEGGISCMCLQRGEDVDGDPIFQWECLVPCSICDMENSECSEQSYVLGEKSSCQDAFGDDAYEDQDECDQSCSCDLPRILAGGNCSCPEGGLYNKMTNECHPRGSDEFCEARNDSSACCTTGDGIDPDCTDTYCDTEGSNARNCGNGVCCKKCGEDNDFYTACRDDCNNTAKTPSAKKDACLEDCRESPKRYVCLDPSGDSGGTSNPDPDPGPQQCPPCQSGYCEYCYPVGLAQDCSCTCDPAPNHIPPGEPANYCTAGNGNNGGGGPGNPPAGSSGSAGSQASSSACRADRACVESCAPQVSTCIQGCNQQPQSQQDACYAGCDCIEQYCQFNCTPDECNAEAPNCGNPGSVSSRSNASENSAGSPTSPPPPTNSSTGNTPPGANSSQSSQCTKTTCDIKTDCQEIPGYTLTGCTVRADCTGLCSYKPQQAGASSSTTTNPGSQNSSDANSSTQDSSASTETSSNASQNSDRSAGDDSSGSQRSAGDDSSGSSNDASRQFFSSDGPTASNGSSFSSCGQCAPVEPKEGCIIDEDVCGCDKLLCPFSPSSVGTGFSSSIAFNSTSLSSVRTGGDTTSEGRNSTSQGTNSSDHILIPHSAGNSRTSTTTNSSSESLYIQFAEDADDENRTRNNATSNAALRANAQGSSTKNTVLGCAIHSECTMGLCEEGDCVPCLKDSECTSQECTQGVCAQSVFVASATLCGNGVLEVGEECDDSNRRDRDGCNSSCLLEIGICGDGKVQSLLGEQCEANTHDAFLPYSCVRCRFLSLSCGDGKIDAGEECDDGALNSTSPDALCRPDCSESRCGDSIIDSVELCDDGNRVNNDGCDRFCRIENGRNAQIASDTTIDFVGGVLGQNQRYGFPAYGQHPYPLPLAQLQPLIQGQAPLGDTGPAAVVVTASGIAAGFGWMRRKRR